MEVVDQCLKAPFVHVVSKITDGRTHDEKENDSTQDDGDLDPFHAGDEGDGEEKDITGKRDKDGNEKGILNIEWELDIIVPDGEENDGDDQECENPPGDFCYRFLFL